jgi:signal transduction histidine kinase
VAVNLDFRLLFESAPGLYLVLTPDFKIVAVSDAHLAATHMKREEAVGRDVFAVFPENPDDPGATSHRSLRASLERVRKQKAPDTMAALKYDIRLPESEGGGYEERFWSIVNSPVLDAGGEIVYIMNRVEDVTDFVRLQKLETEQERVNAALRTTLGQKEAEVFQRSQEVEAANLRLEAANEELVRLYEKSQEMDRTKTRFFSNVSHELRTPLTLILGPVEKLLASGSPGAETRQQLQVVARNAHSLLRRVNDLLDIAKLEAGKMGVRYAQVDAALLVREVASHFDSLARERKMLFTIDAPEPVAAELDSEKVRRILLNLISNAFRFTPDGGRVACSLGERDGNAILRVEDTGPGVPEAFRDAIFDAFRQVDDGPSRRAGGTGLGLAIVKEYAELLRGKVSVGESASGGASFEVRIPLNAPQGATIHHDAEEPSFVAEEQYAADDGVQERFAEPVAVPGDERPLALIVDDNADLNRFVVDSLGTKFRTESAFNGRAGLDKARAIRPDVIVSDIMMPEMTGDEMVREIRRVGELDGTPIIMLTAKADDDMLVDLLRSGAQDYLTKPFRADELLARVTNLVTLGRAKAELQQELNDRCEDILSLVRMLNARKRDLQRTVEDLQAGEIEIKRLNDELEHRVVERTQQLRTVNKDLEAFTSSVAHDLRSPLRKIDGYCAILQEDYSNDLPFDARRYLTLVREGAAHMGNLVNDLLNLSRIGSKELNRRPTALKQVANAVVEQVSSQLNGRAVQWQVGDLPVMLCDPGLIAQVFTNLLDNAAKYTRKQDRAVIEVGRTVRGGEDVLFVRDNGVGFNMEHAGKLFAIFSRLHSAAEFEGTGVGLATVQRIIIKHGGRIWAEAQEGKGATFYFTIGQPQPALRDAISTGEAGSWGVN